MTNSKMRGQVSTGECLNSLRRAVLLKINEGKKRVGIKGFTASRLAR